MGLLETIGESRGSTTNVTTIVNAFYGDGHRSIAMSDTATDTPFLPERTAGLVAAIGVWIFWSGVLLTGTGWIVTLNVLVGATIVTVGAYTAAWPSDGPLPVPTVVAPLVALLLGLVVIALPFLMGVTYELLFWSNIVAGALVVLLSGASMYGSWQVAGTASRA